MSHKATIRALLADAEDAAHEQLLHTARVTLRKVWAKQRVADFFAAQKRWRAEPMGAGAKRRRS